jgi:hypothetical protein
MKTLGKIALAILACLVLALVVLRITGLDPKGLRPGLWLRGNVAAAPVTDWSFADKVQTIQIQTRTWYMLPHSVNIGCVCYDGHLYLSSVQYRPGVKYRWNDDLLRDPHVRIRIGNQLYDRTVVYVTDPAEKAAVLEAKTKKYRADPNLSRRNLTANVFRVVD